MLGLANEMWGLPCGFEGMGWLQLARLQDVETDVYAGTAHADQQSMLKDCPYATPDPDFCKEVRVQRESPFPLTLRGAWSCAEHRD